jgi:hypothetical protein
MIEFDEVGRLPFFIEEWSHFLMPESSYNLKLTVRALSVRMMQKESVVSFAHLKALRAKLGSCFGMNNVLRQQV